MCMVFVELHSIHHAGLPGNEYDCCHDRHSHCRNENDEMRKFYNLVADDNSLDYKENLFDEALHTGPA